MKRIIPFIAAILLQGCVSATAEVESVCATKEVAVAAADAQVSDFVGMRTVTKTFDEDFSDVLSKVTDIGTVTINSTSLSLDGDVSFIRHVSIFLHSDSMNKDLVLASTNLVPYGKSITLPLLVDNSKLMLFLNSGKVVMTVSLTGVIPTAESKVNSNFCFGFSAEASKSLL